MWKHLESGGVEQAYAVTGVGTGTETLTATVTTAAGTFNVTVIDDVVVALTDGMATSSGSVDEDALVAVLPPGEVPGSATATGSVTGLFNAGADTPLTYSFNTSLSGLTGQHLKSGGVELAYGVTTLNGVETLTATVTTAGVTTTVFTLTL